MNPGQQRLILVVDDDPGVLAMVCKVLEAGGYETIAATSGEDAVEALGHNLHKIRLVISDVVMPGLCGIQVAKWLRQRSPSTPILLMTGFLHTEITSAFSDPPPLLLKPFKPATLLAKVGELLQTEEGPIA